MENSNQIFASKVQMQISYKYRWNNQDKNTT